MTDTDFLRELCSGFGIEIDNEAAERFELFSRLIVQKNKVLNLTAITEPREIAVKHFADSLSVLSALEISDGAKVIDVGTGAGFPGLPLLIVRPDLRLTLLDSTRKKLDFIDFALDSLGLRAQTLHARAEEAGQGALRESFDFVLSRAVASLNVLCEYCLPLAAVGGAFCAMKGVRGRQELDQAGRALALLGGSIAEIKEFSLPDGGDRVLINIKKISRTPTKYPRPSAQISKKPLI